MANDFRDRERYRDRERGWRGDDSPSRGMFGYEGEGYIRNRGYGRGESDDIATGFAGHYGPGGYRDLESGADRGWNIGRDNDRGTSYRGRGPKNYQRSDERIREDVCERLSMDHDVDASEIEVTVQDGVVTLDGSINDRHAKRLAEDICESVSGVKDVQNNVRVTR